MTWPTEEAVEAAARAIHPSNPSAYADVARAALAATTPHLPVAPDRDTIARALHRVTCAWPEGCDGAPSDLEVSHADAVLADFPGRTEAEVKAEAWDEGVRAAWAESGEGWNGECPVDVEPRALANNPYRAGGPRG